MTASVEDTKALVVTSRADMLSRLEQSNVRKNTLFLLFGF